jgi:hypothetical protein
MLKKSVVLIICVLLLNGCVSSNQANTDANGKDELQVQKTPTEAQVSNPFTPWSPTFSSNELTEAALKETDKFFGSVNPNKSFELTVDKSFPSTELPWIQQMLEYTNGALANLQGDTMRVFVSGSAEWSKKTLRDKNLWLGNPKAKFPCSADASNEVSCAEDNLILINFFNVQPNQDWYVSRRAIPAHEVFHIIQDSLSGLGINVGPDNPRAIPAWLVEGSANYYGYYVVDRMGFDKYTEHKTTNSWFNYQNGDPVPLIKYNDFSLDPYIIGQMATEYLVASVGFESLINIFKFSRTEGTFVSAFQKATGITTKEFYAKFELARSSINSN